MRFVVATTLALVLGSSVAVTGAADALPERSGTGTWSRGPHPAGTRGTDPTALDRAEQMYQQLLLHGDIDLAIEAMERAVIAGGAAVENREFARVKLADLWLLEGRADRAQDLYETSLDQISDYVPALHGLAKVALAQGDTATAERHLLRAVTVAALPESIVQLGALQEAAGDADLAAATYASAAAMERFHRRSSGVPEPFGAVMEADHGEPRSDADGHAGPIHPAPRRGHRRGRW